MVVELALTELVPNKAGFEAVTLGASTAARKAAAAVGGAAARTIGSKSTVAFEMRVRDGANNRIIAMFADREAEKGSIINVKNFSWYAHAKTIIKEWADQFVKIANKDPDEIVADTAAFSFKPW